jgi:DNA-binding transcriptional LysR family regulator
LLAADAGLGVLGTFIPAYAGDAPRGTIVALPVEGRLPEVWVGLIRRQEEPLPSGADTLANWLRNLSC